MEKKFNYMSDEEKIMYVINKLNAKTLETAITMKMIIEYGIEIGATEDFETIGWEGYENSDHPWWTKMKSMVEDIYLLKRKQIDSHMSNTGRLSHPYVYWYEGTQEYKSHPVYVEKKTSIIIKSERGNRNLNMDWVLKNFQRALRLYGNQPEVVEFLKANGFC